MTPYWVWGVFRNDEVLKLKELVVVQLNTTELGTLEMVNCVHVNFTSIKVNLKSSF
jgi:hypothetical protein